MTKCAEAADLLHDELKVVNVGLDVFYRSLIAQGVCVMHVNWRPPAGGDPTLAGLLDKLSGRGPISQ